MTRVLVLCTLVLCLLSNFEEDLGAATISVNNSVQYQPIESWGTRAFFESKDSPNYTREHGLTWVQLRDMIVNLGMTHVQVPVDPKNGEFSTFKNWEGLAYPQVVAQLESRGVRFVPVGYFYPLSVLTANSTYNNPRYLVLEETSANIAWVADWWSRVVDQGVTVLDIYNEPTISTVIKVSAAGYAQTVQEIHNRRANAKFLAPSGVNPGWTIVYNSSLGTYPASWFECNSSHAYESDALTTTDFNRVALAGLVELPNLVSQVQNLWGGALGVWQTEYAANGVSTQDTSINHGIAFAQNIRNWLLNGARGYWLWQLGYGSPESDLLEGKGSTLKWAPFASAMGEYARSAPKGSRRIEMTSDDSDVIGCAFRWSDGQTFGILLINLSTSSKTVSFNGLGSRTLALRKTTQSDRMVAFTGTTIPARSVVSIVASLSGGTATSTPTATRTPTAVPATQTPTRTATRTPTAVPATQTPTRTATRTPTAVSATQTPTRTATRTPTAVPATQTPTRTATQTPTSAVNTPTVTRTPTRTATVLSTRTPTPVPTLSSNCDDFQDGNYQGWSVLSGSWNVVNGVLEGRSLADEPHQMIVWNNLSMNSGTIQADMTGLPGSVFSNGFILFGFKNSADWYYAGAWTNANVWVIGRYNGSFTNLDSSAQTIALGQTYRLRVEINNSLQTAQLYVDNQLRVASSVQGDLSGGMGLIQVKSLTQWDNYCCSVISNNPSNPTSTPSPALTATATRTPTPPPSPTLTATPKPGLTLPFCDDFNDGNANGWIVNSGQWTVQNGRYLSLANGDTRSVTRLMGSSSVGVRITLDVLDLNTGPNNNFHILLGYQGPDDYWYAGCWIGSQKWVIGRLLNGVLQTMSFSVDSAIVPGMSGTLDLRTRNGEINLYFRDDLKVSYSVGSQISQGELGLLTIQSETQFDNVCVQP